MVEAGLTPAHTYPFEPLLNEPLAGAFHEPAADRPAVSLEPWVIEMRLMGVEIVLEIGEGPTCRFGQRWRGEQRLQLCRDLRLAPVAQVVTPAPKGCLTALGAAIKGGFGALIEILGSMVKIPNANHPEALKAAHKQVPTASAPVTEPNHMRNTAHLLAQGFEP